MIADVFDLIDWEVIGQAMEITPNLYQIWASKKETGLCVYGNIVNN